jgi:hypothetical protein
VGHDGTSEKGGGDSETHFDGWVDVRGKNGRLVEGGED